MSLRHMLDQIGKAYFKGDHRREYPDPTPIEVSPSFTRPVSSLDDLRLAMEAVSRLQEQAGNESFEEFYDFGEDADFEDIPAPAQAKFEAVMLARDRDFEGEVLKAKEEYKLKINEEAREELLKEYKKRESARRASDQNPQSTDEEE